MKDLTQYHVGGAEISEVFETSAQYTVGTVDGLKHGVPKADGNRDYQVLQLWISDGGVSNRISSAVLSGTDYVITLQGGSTITIPKDPNALTDDQLTAFAGLSAWQGEGNTITGDE